MSIWKYSEGEEETRAQSHSSMYAILAESKEPHNGRGRDWVSWALNCKGSVYEGCGEGVCPLVRLLICTQASVFFSKAFHLSGVERRHHHRHNRQKSALFQAKSGGTTSFTWLSFAQLAIIRIALVPKWELDWHTLSPLRGTRPQRSVENGVVRCLPGRTKNYHPYENALPKHILGFILVLIDCVFLKMRKYFF